MSSYSQLNTQVMWEGEEKIFFGCLDEAFGTYQCTCSIYSWIQKSWLSMNLKFISICIWCVHVYDVYEFTYQIRKGTCCGCCPEDPSTYKLTQSYMKVKKVNPIRVGFITCPCHSSYTINNIDLTYVNDVDVLGVPPPLCQKVLCCAQGKDIVDISTTTDDGKVLLFLHQDLGEPVANLILVSFQF